MENNDHKPSSDPHARVELVADRTSDGAFEIRVERPHQEDRHTASINAVPSPPVVRSERRSQGWIFAGAVAAGLALIGIGIGTMTDRNPTRKSALPEIVVPTARPDFGTENTPRALPVSVIERDATVDRRDVEEQDVRPPIGAPQPVAAPSPIANPPVAINPVAPHTGVGTPGPNPTQRLNSMTTQSLQNVRAENLRGPDDDDELMYDDEGESDEDEDNLAAEEEESEEPEYEDEDEEEFEYEDEYEDDEEYEDD